MIYAIEVPPPFSDRPIVFCQKTRGLLATESRTSTVTEVPVVQLKGLVKAETGFQPLGYLGTYLFILVGGAIAILENMKVNGKDYT